MVEFLIKRPIASIMTFLAIVLLGLVAMNLIPISLLPNIDIPEITVHLDADNKSLYVIEKSIVAPMRNQLLQVSGVKDVRSETKNNKALIRLTFDFGVDIDYAFIEVNDKIDAVMSTMPNGIRRPRIIKANAGDIPVFSISVNSKNHSDDDASFVQLSDFVKNIVRKRLEQLPEVAVADITGTVESEIYITPDVKIVRSLGLTMDDVALALVQNNIETQSIILKDGHYQYNARFKNELKSIDDIRNIFIRKSGRIFKLEDLATVGLRPQQKQGVYYNKYDRAINIAIIKHSSAQINTMKAKVNEVLDYFEDKYPNISFEISQDQSLILNYSMNNLKQSLLIGCILAIVIMFLFIRNPIAPLLIAFSIPVSLIISVLIFYLLDMSINIISLSGLILGVGMMIDNSIIVIDNIAQHLKTDKSHFQAIVKGVNEVIRPLLASVLTTCAVFIPLIFLSGITGELFYDQSIAVAVGLFVSLIVSVTLLPVLYKLFNIDRVKESKRSFVLFDVEKYYSKSFDFVFKYRRIVFLLFFVFMLSGVYYFNQLDKRQIPTISQTELIVEIDWVENISLSENVKRVRQIVDVLPENCQVNSYIGVQDFLLNSLTWKNMNQSRLYINAYNQDSVLLIKGLVRKFMSENYSNSDFQFGKPGNIFERVFSGIHKHRFILELSSRNGALLPSQEELDNTVANVRKYLDVEMSNKADKQFIIEFELNFRAMLRYDVDVRAVEDALKKAYYQVELIRLAGQGSFIPVVQGENLPFNGDLKSVFVVNNAGVRIPLSEFVSVKNTFVDKQIYSNEGGAYLSYPVHLDENQIADIEGLEAGLNNVSDLQIKISGSWFEFNQLIREMLTVLVLSLLLLYFILAAQFESLFQPVIILLEIPIALSGGLLFLVLFDSSVNVLSMIGAVVMTGIVINDSILKLDTINKLRKEGVELYEAIHLGGTRRLKPIIMTSLTTILALVPFLFGKDIGSELQFPLALTIIGGLLIGTIISLYFIPLVYYFYSTFLKKK